MTRSPSLLRSSVSLAACTGAVVLAALPGVHADDAPYGVDPAFGDGGFVRVAPARPHNFGPDAAVDPLGRVLALTVEFPAAGVGSARTHVRRLLADGTPDATFGVSGQAVIDPELGSGAENSSYTHVTTDGLGRVILVRGPESDLRPRAQRELAVRRLDAAGIQDDGFGEAGIVKVAAPDQLDTHGEASVVAYENGSMLVAYTQLGPGSPAKPTVRVVKFTEEGEIDDSFGEGGFAMLPANFACWPNAMALDAQGRIVVAGGIDYVHDVPTVHDTTYPTILLARFLADGTPDPEFGTGAELRSDAGAPDGEVSSFTMDADGSVLADVDQGLWRFDADGRNAELATTQLHGGTGVPAGTDSLLTWERVGDSGFFAQRGTGAAGPEVWRIDANVPGQYPVFHEFLRLADGSALAVGEELFASGILLVKFKPGGVTGGPDLRVSIEDVEVGARTINGRFTVTNAGAAARRSAVRLLLSDDSVAHATDDALKTVRIGRIAPGKSKTVRFRVRVPRGIVVYERFVLASADARPGSESWRADNTAAILID